MHNKVVAPIGALAGNHDLTRKLTDRRDTTTGTSHGASVKDVSFGKPLPRSLGTCETGRRPWFPVGYLE